MKYSCVAVQIIESDVPFYRKVNMATINMKHGSSESNVDIFDLGGFGVYSFENGETTPSFMWHLANDALKGKVTDARSKSNAFIINEVKQRRLK